MALEQPSAPSCASSRVPDGTPRSGVIHVNTWHASRYTVIGNHLLQHRELSATAIGIAAHIQSLPEGAPVGIRALTDRFPEGEKRISTALRELERYGYLERRTERQATGRVVTRTYSYNKPLTGPDGPPPPPPPPGRAPDPALDPTPTPVPTPAPDSGREPQPGPAPEAGPRRVLDAEPEHEPEREPEPRHPHPGAADLLAGLRRYDPRLLLAERDVERLAPAVSLWLDRGADPEAVGLALSANLPEPMRNPASVLAYRLKALLPPRRTCPWPRSRRPSRSDARTPSRPATAANAPSAPPTRAADAATVRPGRAQPSPPEPGGLRG